MPGSNASLHGPAKDAATAALFPSDNADIVQEPQEFLRGGPPGDSVSLEVERALDYFRTNSPLVLDQRGSQRHAFPCPVDLWPIENGQIIQSPMVVIGKNLSRGGIAFFHLDPIPQRQAVIGLPCGDHRLVHLLTEIHWCRFLRAGWYDGGGRFLRLVRDPAESAR